MTDKEIGQPIIKTVVINATPAKVWAALTKPELMRQWMSETPLDIITDWKVGNTITIRGDWYKAGFENKGIVLEIELERLVKYSHLSSLSRLKDKPGNYTVLEFRLTPKDAQTSLTLTLSNFPTEAIYKHFAFYWSVGLELLRKFAEQQ
ncbi:MAG: SRPBCC domain-containing protein [Bacteroidetes bacterium]|nr:SRPBCC domain-containing protein [Bacteroidota bacterium]